MTSTTAIQASQPLLLTPEQFIRLRDLLAAYSGMYLDNARQRIFEAGLTQRLAATGDSLEMYENRLRAPDSRVELQHLAELVLNHETFFFRNQPHMRALRSVLLPEIHRRKPARAPIRIWSAGCASGEEAYSLAILALETLGNARPVEIWGTDLSAPAIERARTGFYTGRTLTNVSAELLERYFVPQGRGYTVGEPVRRMVQFETFNLLEPFPAVANGLDIIFCQNVLIYFQLDTGRKLIERFYQSLPEGGFLFLGFSETLWNVFDGFRSREVSGAYVYYKEAYNIKTPAIVASRPVSHGTPARGERNRQAPAEKPAGRGQLSTPADAPRRQTAQLSLTPTVIPPARWEDTPTEAPQLMRVSGTAEGHARDGPGPQALLVEARQQADRGELDLALTMVMQAITIDPMLDDGYTLLGTLYSRQGRWQSAAQQFERARYLNPASPQVSFQLAECYRQGGRHAPAAREYRSTLRKLAPYPPDALIDGVAVHWIRETCQRQLERLAYSG